MAQTKTQIRHTAVWGVAFLALISCRALAATVSLAQLEDLSLEELGNITVTSVSKRGEKLSEAPASIFVITHEDIRRSGVTNLPEALRLAPNLQVVQVYASGYTVSARGFSNSAANKLLVLIDGRSVYSPLFSGVFWDVQDVMLEDVDRIEVISGPAGTLWGVNAVNGVINIITKSAQATQGGLASADAGNRGHDGAVRYGGALANGGSYRVYAKYVDRNPTTTANGVGKDDAWARVQAGFRSDWDNPGDKFTVQGDIYNGDDHQPLPGMLSTGVPLALGTISLAGANLNGRWTHDIDEQSSVMVQAYYDRTHRNVPPTFAETLDIADLQVQHSLQPSRTQQWTWGAEYRGSWDRVRNSIYISFLPANLHQEWMSLFGQGEFDLADDLRLTLGARFEHNDYTGLEFLPSARLAKKIDENSMLWGAVSRTVRAPSRLDRDVYVPYAPGLGPPFLLRGGPDVVSEVANVFELGYRAQPRVDLNYSITAYHADYDHLRTQEVVLSSPPYVFFANGMEGSTTGLEAWATFRANEMWRLSAGWTGLHQTRTLKPGSNDASAVGTAGLDPANSFNLRSSWDLSARTELDITLRHVAALANPAVPAYTTIDMRYGWKVDSHWDFALVGQNLFGPGHAEFFDPATRTDIGPAVYLKAQAYF